MGAARAALFFVYWATDMARSGAVGADRPSERARPGRPGAPSRDHWTRAVELTRAVQSEAEAGQGRGPQPAGARRATHPAWGGSLTGGRPIGRARTAGLELDATRRDATRSGRGPGSLSRTVSEPDDAEQGLTFRLAAGVWIDADVAWSEAAGARSLDPDAASSAGPVRVRTCVRAHGYDRSIHRGGGQPH